MTECSRSKFGRYYTKPVIGQTLVNLMNLRQPAGLIDLGVGGGSLTVAAARRWSNLHLLTIDVDPASDQHLSKLLAREEIGSHLHLRADALEPSLAGLVREEFGKVDAAVCNPPFTTPIWKSGFDEILEESGFSGCMPVLADADSALLFLSQALRLLGQGSTLGIILPDSLISGAKYRKFRHELLRRYRVDVVVRLPTNSFMHTAALAHIVVIRKGYGGSEQVPLRKLVNGRLLDRIALVDVERAAYRMDYDYHATAVAMTWSVDQNNVRPLSDLIQSIQRGSMEASASRMAGIEVFHTTDMLPSLAGRWIALTQKAPIDGEGPAWASPGDLLVARVGRNLETKVLGVQSGGALLTDCIYRIRMPRNLARQALAQLSSESGRAWLASRSSGVGAEHLSMAELLTFPVSQGEGKCLAE
jgi:type I restriction enzyme M protein